MLLLDIKCAKLCSKSSSDKGLTVLLCRHKVGPDFIAQYNYNVTNHLLRQEPARRTNDETSAKTLKQEEGGTVRSDTHVGQRFASGSYNVFKKKYEYNLTHLQHHSLPKVGS